MLSKMFSDMQSGINKRVNKYASDSNNEVLLSASQPRLKLQRTRKNDKITVDDPLKNDSDIDIGSGSDEDSNGSNNQNGVKIK